MSNGKQVRPVELPPVIDIRRKKIHTLAFISVAAGILLLCYFFIFKDLPSPTNLDAKNIPFATKMYDRNGVLLFDIFADQNRTWVPLSDIPLSVRQATISIEDKDFYKHQGVNPVGGILRALAATIRSQQLQGGSTITQQLVKSALLTQKRTLVRKTREIILAYWVELLYPKDKILEMYLNQVPYGGTAWGIEAASEKYFGKKVSELSLSEASLLAGLPQAPTLYSPFGNHPEMAIKRQKEVLRRMVEDGYISDEEADTALRIPLQFAKPGYIKAPHFVMYVKEHLVDTYGVGMVERGGLQVKTTLDVSLQEYAQATVAAEIKTLKSMNVTNGAAIITKPSTGEILAMVGSADYFATPSGNFNVTTALRQPGSSIKPINYAIGIEKNIVTPATMFLDVPTCFRIINQPNYCPKNYDGKFHGPVQLRFALGNSYNIPAVKMLYLNTVSDMVASASAFGLETLKDPDTYGLSLTLGGGEVRMIDMAEAFGVFANGGIHRDVTAILKVTDRNGTVLEENKDPNIAKDIPSQLLLKGNRVVSPETAFLISHILLDNNARQPTFGPASTLVIPGHAVSVKTGTTDDLRDNWTIGYTPQILVATWVGNNNNSPMNRSLVSGVTGAAPIWNKLITHALFGKPDVWPKQPEGIVGAHICSVSGLLPPTPDVPSGGEGSGCPTRIEYFIAGTLPKEKEHLRRSVPVDDTTGDLAAAGKIDGTQVQDHDILTDPISSYCLDCLRKTEVPVYIK